MHALLVLPQKLEQTITAVHGERGAEWIAKLDETLAECERRWGITIGEPFPKLTYNLVVQAWGADGTEFVLKLGVPGRETVCEIRALRHFGGHPCVHLIDHDEQLGVQLLERLTPGTSLADLADEPRSVHIFTEVVTALHRPAPAEDVFPTLADWFRGLDRLRDHFADGSGPFSQRLVSRAHALSRELLVTTDTVVLLHGDLHHDNILAAGDGRWVAIDPKGLVGDPTYEVVAFLINYLLSQPHPDAVLRQRVAAVCNALGYDRRRVLAWGLAHSVLSAWWLIEDQLDGWEDAIQRAELFAHLLAELGE